MGDRIEVNVAIVDDETGDQILSLHNWLTEDDDLLEVTLAQVEAPALPREMTGGGLVTALIAILSDPELLTALAGAVGAWFAAQAATRRTKIHVRRGAREITVDSAMIKDPDKVAEQLYDKLRETP